MRVLCDFHHSSLLRSLVLLFEDRLGMELYRPIGMEWFHEGYWAINDQEDTARQFLDYYSQPLDNTPPLNDGAHYGSETARVLDPGGNTKHNACTLEFFKANRFDLVIASIPAHVPLFEKLIREYQPHARLIVQMGNNWNIDQYAGYNVLASIAPQVTAANAYFYHQEFDLTVFNDTPVPMSKKIYSFVNVIRNSGIGYDDYFMLKKMLEPAGWQVKSFGGQNPDGNTDGAEETATIMREADFILHVKPGGDGFGHVIHNAYAVGRPLITRPSHYKGQLAQALLVPGTFIDLDKYTRSEVKNIVTRLHHSPDELARMGERAAQRFREVVDYGREAEEIKEWLGGLS